MSINNSTLREGKNYAYVKEAARSIPIRKDVDVLVVGGGLAGVSAAVAAARTGAKTLLIERNGFPGGVATAGMCCSVFNCFYTPSHELIVKGNALEFVDELARAEGPGSGWHNHKGHIIFDIERGKLTLIELLEMVIGQGAGIAAAISVQDNVIPRDVNIATVQKELRQQGVDLG